MASSEFPVGLIQFAYPTFTLLCLIAGWVWYLSHKASELEFLERRIAALEVANIARNTRIDDMADRLARMESMIAFLVERIKTARPV